MTDLSVVILTKNEKLRYVVKRGIAGWMWHFWQGLWYRCLVDREIGRMRSS